MPTMNGQDDVLFGHIAAKQWKQALKACEKKLKMTPGSDYLLVTKISILLQWSDQARLGQGLQELNSLIERKPPVADIEALRAMDTVIDFLTPMIDFDPKQKQTWQRAAASRPHDAKLHEAWYWIKFGEMDFRGAQQACMTWMKNFPKERNPFFLYILNTHLISIQAANEQERSLMQTLAYRTISKAAKDKQVPIKGASNAGREINYIEDLSLLLRVYLEQGRYDEAAEVLIDPRVGFDTYVGGHRWELVSHYLGLLNVQQRWRDLRDVCVAILRESRDNSVENTRFKLGKLGDDWKVWQTLITANAKDDPINNSSAVEELILSFCGTSGKTTERNARMAQLLFYAVEVSAGREDEDVLLTVLIKYFQTFSTKFVCFSDVKQWLPHIDTGRQKQLLLDSTKLSQDLAPQPGDPESSMIYWITCEINVLKLEYNLVISQDRNSHNADLLTTFISNCLRLYKESLAFGLDLPVSDRRPGDDAALLAAMGLVRLFKLGRKLALLQCIVVLEHTLLQSKHNYDALLILVRLYLFLGAGSLAMERYSRLSIKNLQHATISWVLYTRISSIQPYPATYSINGKRQSTIDPLQDILHACKWHTSAEVVSMGAVHKMQANGQWNMSLDAFQTNQAVTTGFAKYLLVVEAKRIARIRSSAYESPKETIRIPNQTKDQRDREAFPNFEGGGLPFESHLPIAGTSVEPNDAWLHQQLSLALFWDVLNNNGQSQILEEQLRALWECSKEEPDALTSQEHAIAHLVLALSALHSLYSQRDQYEREAGDVFIQDLFEYVEDWLAKSSERLASSDAPWILTPNLRVPLWSFFHDLFTHLEMCKFVIPTLEYTVSENKKQPRVGQIWLADRVKALRNQCTKLADTIVCLAKKIRDKHREQATLRQLEEVVFDGFDETEREDVVASELMNLGDHTDLKKMCQDIRDSWVDGLDGVIRTKIA